MGALGGLFGRWIGSALLLNGIVAYVMKVGRSAAAHLQLLPLCEDCCTPWSLLGLTRCGVASAWRRTQPIATGWVAAPSKR